MVNLGPVFRKNLNHSKQIIEGQLEISLSNLKAYPLWIYGISEFRYDKEFSVVENIKDFFEDCIDYFEMGMKDTNTVGKAGNRGVYYGKECFTQTLSQYDAKKILFHELYHVALARYAGFDDIYCEEFESMVPELLDESFAELMAINMIKETGIDIKSKSLKNEAAWLNYELSKANIENPKDIADFVIRCDAEKEDYLNLAWGFQTSVFEKLIAQILKVNQILRGQK